MAKGLLAAPGGRRKGAILAQALLAAAVLDGSHALAAPRDYVVEGPASRVRVHVGKSGVFKFAGHEHEVLAEVIRGLVKADPEALAASSVEVEIDAGSLRVDAAGEPSGDAPKVQEIMAGPQVLDVARFGTIAFRSTAVSGKARGAGVYDIQVQGDLTLHGVTRHLVVPLRVEVAGGRLVTTGRFAVGQDDFGIKAVSAGGGTVKVRNEVEIEIRLVAAEKH